MPEQCIVTLGTTNVEPCYVFRPWIFEESLMANMERKWGRKYGTFNHDLEVNTIYLRKDLRRLFESDLLALFPLDVDLMDDMMTSKCNCEYPIETLYKEGDTYEYRLVPLPGAPRSAITRTENSSSFRRKRHAFPYTTLPILRLPIHPHYAAIDFAYKFSKHEEKNPDIRSSAEIEPYADPYDEEIQTCVNLSFRWLSLNVPYDYIRSSGDDDALRAAGKTVDTFKRKGAYVFLPEDPGSYWKDDKVGLRPLDSVTNVSGEEDDDTSDEEDANAGDEDLRNRSEFNAWMRRWIGDVAAGHQEEHLEPDERYDISTTAVPPLIPSDDDDSDESDRASPSIITTVKDVDVCRGSQDAGFPQKLNHSASHRTRTLSAMSVDSPTFARS